MHTACEEARYLSLKHVTELRYQNRPDYKCASLPLHESDLKDTEKINPG